MKRQILFMLVALIFTHLEMSAQQNKAYAGALVQLNCTITDDVQGFGNQFPRSPIRIVIPSVSIDGNILYIKER